MDLKELKIALDWAENNFKKCSSTESIFLLKKITNIFDEECKNYIYKLNVNIDKNVIKDNIKDFLDFATPIYWEENQYTEYEDILDLYLEKLHIDELYNFYCKTEISKLSEMDKYSFDTQPITKNMFIDKLKGIESFRDYWNLEFKKTIK